MAGTVEGVTGTGKKVLGFAFKGAAVFGIFAAISMFDGGSSALAAAAQSGEGIHFGDYAMSSLEGVSEAANRLTQATQTVSGYISGATGQIAADAAASSAVATPAAVTTPANVMTDTVTNTINLG